MQRSAPLAWAMIAGTSIGWRFFARGVPHNKRMKLTGAAILVSRGMMVF
jgi:hypothetical protein